MFGTRDQICGILSAPALKTSVHSICVILTHRVENQGAALAKIMYCKDVPNNSRKPESQLDAWALAETHSCCNTA